MNKDLTLAELRSRLDRLGAGAVLRISDHDYERLFGINEVAAAKAAQFCQEAPLREHSGRRLGVLPKIELRRVSFGRVGAGCAPNVTLNPKSVQRTFSRE
ncbi:hypothetical protein ACVWY2_007954 [Bradyrhizobium sp. JR6.1]